MFSQAQVSPMKESHKRNALGRLKTVRGHMDAVIQMVEEERYCPQVLKQVSALQASLALTSIRTSPGTDLEETAAPAAIVPGAAIGPRAPAVHPLCVQKGAGSGAVLRLQIRLQIHRLAMLLRVAKL